MYCIIKCIVQGKQARVKNANLLHPSSMCHVKPRNITEERRSEVHRGVSLKAFSWFGLCLILEYLLPLRDSTNFQTEENKLRKY